VFGANETSIGFSYDYFDVGLGKGGLCVCLRPSPLTRKRAARHGAPGTAGRELQRVRATAISARRGIQFDAVGPGPALDSMRISDA